MSLLEVHYRFCAAETWQMFITRSIILCGHTLNVRLWLQLALSAYCLNNFVCNYVCFSWIFSAKVPPNLPPGVPLIQNYMIGQPGIAPFAFAVSCLFSYLVLVASLLAKALWRNHYWGMKFSNQHRNCFLNRLNDHKELKVVSWCKIYILV